MTNEQASTLGRRIRALRERRGIKPHDLAARAGLSPSGIYKIEQGQSAPNLDTVSAIARALEVPLMELLGGQDEPTEDETLEVLIRRIVEQEGVDPKMAEELTRQLLQYIHLPYEVRHNIYRYAVYLAREEGIVPPAPPEAGSAERGTDAHDLDPPPPVRRRPAPRSDAVG